MTRLDGLTRFGHVNCTAADVESMDPEYWRDVWARADLQAITLNVGGSVAYYPTDLDDQSRLPGIGARDTFGEMAAIARDLGIEVIARLDIGVVDQTFLDLHPEWVMTDAEGRSRNLRSVTGRPWGNPGSVPIENDLFYTRINSSLFSEHLPALLTEVAERYDVAGFFTNGFPTLGLVPPSARLTCHCAECVSAWAEFGGGRGYPESDDPTDPAFRSFVAFLQHRTREAVRRIQAHTAGLPGAPTFITSTQPSPAGGLPWTEWTEDVAQVFLTDSQDRALDYARATPPPALWEVGLSSSLIRSVAGRRPAVRCIGTYRARHGRHTSKEPVELGLQMAVAFAHGEQSQWHTVSGRQWSRRWTPAAVDFDAWLADSGVNLGSLPTTARVGIAWSQHSAWHEHWLDAPDREPHYDAVAGWYRALYRSGIPADLVNAEILDRLEDLDLLILPSGFTATPDTLERIGRFVEGGGGLIAVADAGRRDEWGQLHSEDTIGALLGVTREMAIGPFYNTYLRRTGSAEEAKLMTSPTDDDVIPATGRFTLFTATDAERAFALNREEWMFPTNASGLPAAELDTPGIAMTTAGGVAGAFLGHDLDVAYFRHRVSDHLALLRGVVERTLGDRTLPVRVLGDGYVEVHAYASVDATYIALVNLQHPGADSGAVDDLVPIRDVVLTIDGWSSDGRAELLRGGGFAVPPPDGVPGDIVIDRILDFEVVRVTPRSAAD